MHTQTHTYQGRTAQTHADAEYSSGLSLDNNITVLATKTATLPC